MVVFDRGSYGLKYCVATEHPLATYYALKVLEDGGNVFDAALTASAVLSVVLPHLNGLGGDLLGLVRSCEGGEVEFINGSGWAPKNLTLEYLESKGLREVPLHGPLSATVPGFFEGFRIIYENYCNLGLEEILKPAIKIAKEGYIASWGLWGRIRDLRRGGILDGGFKEILRYGRRIQLRNLADVFSEVAKTGPRSFYEGWPAEELVKHVEIIGGVMSFEDLKEFRGEAGEPIKTDYMGWEVFECPPNTQGPATILMLNLLEQLKKKDETPNSKERIYRFVKAAEIAYHVRNLYLGDPKFVNIDLDLFTSKDRALKLLKTVKPRNVEITRHGTTYFAVADKDGNLASLVQSLYYPFGSKILVPRLGVILNNRASYFKRKGPNKLEGWKRPLHTLSSMIISRGEKIILLGTSGGDYRPQIHSYILQNIVEYNMSLQEAIGYPRTLLSTGKLIVEEGLSKPTRTRYKVETLPYPGSTGVAQGILIDSDYIVGASDLRGDGASLAL